MKYSLSALTSLLLLAPSAIVALPSGVQDSNLEPRAITSASVDAKFKAKGKQYFGVATDKNLLAGGSAAVIQRNFGQVSPENSMKWDALERKTTNSSQLADTFANFHH